VSSLTVETFMKLFSNNKKAVSPVVATLLLVALTVSATAIVYFVVVPMLKENKEILFDISSVDETYDYDHDGTVDALRVKVVVADTKGTGAVSMGSFQYRVMSGEDSFTWQFSEAGATEIDEGSEGSVIIYSLSETSELTQGASYTLQMVQGSSKDSLAFQVEEPSLGPKVIVTVVDHEETLILGADVDFYLANNAFLGKPTEITNDLGKVETYLKIGDYKVRVKYCGQLYWSEPFSHFSQSVVTVVVGSAQPTMKVTVQNDHGGLEDLTGFAFDGLGRYNGQSATTDTSGNAYLTINPGTYTFKVYYLHANYSSSLITFPEVNSTTIDIGGGMVYARVIDTDEIGINNARVYLYSSSGHYRGVSIRTNASGYAAFSLTEGSYKFRVDYGGARSWSDSFGASDGAIITIYIGGKVYAHVVYGPDNEPIANTRVYLYTATGHYTGRSGRTNATGYLLFNPVQSGTWFKFRVDYAGSREWSSEFNGSNSTTIVDINIGAEVYAHVIYGEENNYLANVRVYLYTASGHYSGLSTRTNDTGYARFNGVLKGTDYKFRVDYAGSRYWSRIFNGSTAALQVIDVNIGGTVFAHVLYGPENQFLSNVRVYLYTATGHYSGLSTRTNDTGYARFNGVIATTTYKFRVDYAGSRYWSQTFNGSIDKHVIDINIGGIVYAHVTYGPNDDYLANVRVYLYTASGHYSGLSTRTNTTGYAQFNGVIATTSYKFRVNYAGGYFWSSTFNGSLPVYVHKTNIGGTIFCYVHDNGTPVSGAQVYLYTLSGHYAGFTINTNSSGYAQFNGVLSTVNYQFRVSYGGDNYWSENFNGSIDNTIISVDISIGPLPPALPFQQPLAINEPLVRSKVKLASF
jgi:flagellin-like protein